MPRKGAKRPAEEYPLGITEKQRESLLHATRIKPALRKKLEAVRPDAKVVMLTLRELERLGEEIIESSHFADKSDKARLNALLDKVDALLHEIEGKDRLVVAPGGIYQFKVTLKGSKPPIWRRIQVPDGTLGELHEILQIVMGWEYAHLHQFIARGEYYGMTPEPGFLDMGPETTDENEVLISEVLRKGRKGRLIYEYDFGDGWEHEVVLEKALAPEPGVDYPRCIDGARACPPEDCGGVWGYADFLDAIGDSSHPNHEDMIEWIGGTFDPDEFSVDEVNEQLQELDDQSSGES
jgi:hypothetical protein